MCGVVGAFSVENISRLKSKVNEMNQIQHHRGPDGEGLWCSDNQNVILAHKRLAILDLSAGGNQPMQTKDQRYTISYNGEIYNYKELKERCLAAGSVFTTSTDTEVILECVKQFGIEIISSFRGMWAFVIFDQLENKVYLSRDHFGIKPLYYAFDEGVLFVASEIKSLRLTNKKFSLKDEDTVSIFLEYGYLDYGEWTFFKNIKRFPAGQYSTLNLNESIDLKFKKYWNPELEIDNEINEDQAAKKLDLLFKQSIDRHMISDVDLSFCLSGGLDSSLIVGAAVDSQSKNNESSLNTFTTYYPKYKEINEASWAQIAVDYCGVNPTWVEPTFDEFMSDFNKVLYYHDEPFGSLSIFAQNSIFKSISNSGIKVSLDGQGADELFAGYNSYLYFNLIYLLKTKKFRLLLSELFWVFVKKPKIILNNFKKLNVFMKANKVADNIKLSKEAVNRLKVFQTNNIVDFKYILLRSIQITALPQLLRNGDRNSMKSSVESRVPFLDIDLINFILTLPNSFKIRKATTKYLLRKIALNYLPEVLVYRKDKLGFPSPEKEWLRKGFDIDVPGPFTKKYRKFIVKEWEAMLEKGRVV